MSSDTVIAARKAARRPDVIEAMGAFYQEADRLIAAQGATCWNRGLCCEFGRYGHRLYVTTLEVAYYLAAGDAPPEVVGDACPHAQGGRCQAREHRPLGCRVYYCDVAAQCWQSALTEGRLADLRRLHEQLAVPYHYGDWIAILEALSMHGPSSQSQPRRARAVLFDMDGTLTRPFFDFDAIRREIGLPTEPRTPILESLATMAPSERSRAERILWRYEDEAARVSELWDDTLTVLAAIREAGMATGVITRNSRRSVETVIAKHGLSFDLVYTREDGPVKPLPDPVLSACGRLGIAPASTWVIGDYLFDLQSGNAAGATTVLMVGDADPPAFADQADHVIRRLSELIALLAIPNGPIRFTASQ